MMKTIFCATDFSDAGNNAAFYAARLAAAMDARLVIGTAYSVPVAPLEVPASAEADVIMAQRTTESMNNLVSQLSDIYPLHIIKEISLGFPADFIREAGRRNQADLIVLGNRHTSPVEYYLFGNTLNSLLQYNMKIPVLSVPEDAKFREPSLIAIAFDLEHVPGRQKGKWLDLMIGRFRPELQAFYVSKVKEKELAGIELVAENEKVGMEPWDAQLTFIQGLSVTDGIRDYIRHHKPDILAMVPGEHGWWKRLTLQTNTRKALQQVNIPVLLL